jgi:preprotein translocase subunit SecD
MTVTVGRLLKSRLSFWLVLTAAAVYFMYNIRSNIRFGIDLVGGTYITLEVELEKAHDIEMQEQAQNAEALLKEKNQPVPASKSVENGMVTFKFADAKQASAASAFLLTALPDVLVASNGEQVTLQLSSEQWAKFDRDAVASNVTAIGNRMDGFGTSEHKVVALGGRRIVVELPDIKNLDEAKATIGKPAMLEIKPIEGEGDSEKQLIDRYGGQLPEGTMIVKGRSGPDGVAHKCFLVSKFTDVTGKLLRTARPAFHESSGHVVEFEFKPVGASRFHTMTSNNIGKRLAIIIDGVVISDPVVETAIGAHGIITGQRDSKDAKTLALFLCSGAFAAPVRFEEERHIEPSLGSEAIHQGMFACLMGLLLLFIFCVVVYKVLGLFAFLVLVYNMVLTLFLLVPFGSTLTLPGIAGMILSIGAAVDASILIFERIREELALGTPARKAIDAGFSGALAVILDSNITSLLVAMVLFYFGQGGIRGFATVQIAGIVATLVTGLWLLKSFLTFLTDVLGVKTLRV